MSTPQQVKLLIKQHTGKDFTSLSTAELRKAIIAITNDSDDTSLAHAAMDVSREHFAAQKAKPTKEDRMKFPMLQMLAEGKKKKEASMDDMDADMNMDMEVDTSMAPAKKSKSTGDKKSAAKGMKDTPSASDEMIVDKAAVLKFLKGTTSEDRKSICTRLTKMVAADEESAE